MQETISSRARGCLLGLASGDALGAPTEGKSQDAIARQWGRVTDFLRADQAGSDDTDYALFNARLLLEFGPHISANVIADAWKKEIVSAANTYRGAGFSEMLAIRNLNSGLGPPASGRHLHAWSDGLAMRVAPFGIVAAGRPDLAADLAAMDGSVTHSGEGIYAGRAVAAAVACAMEGSPVSAMLEAAVSVIPGDSWTRRAIDRATGVGAASPDVWSALIPLVETVVFKGYFWSDLAPEAVALAFGLVVASRGVFRDAVLGGVNVGRDTDTIAAIAGALLGAQQGENVLPPEWTRRVLVSRGECLAIVKGMDIAVTANRLADLARRWESQP